VKDVIKDYIKEVYTYEELLSDPLPKGVDPTRLEVRSDDDIVMIS